METHMGIVFDWDARKARSNATKHGVTFEEGSTVLGDPLSLTIVDPTHSDPDDERFVTIGSSHRDRLLVVAHQDEDETIRIISVRKAMRHERKDYEKSE